MVWQVATKGVKEVGLDLGQGLKNRQYWGKNKPKGRAAVARRSSETCRELGAKQPYGESLLQAQAGGGRVRSQLMSTGEARASES